MGKRKTKKIKQSKSHLTLKNRRKLDKEFHCHFCQHDKSVSIKIDMRSAVGFLTCRICGADFSTRVTSLDEPIDVYTIWMDKCRESDKVLVSKEEVKVLKAQDNAMEQDSTEKQINDEVHKDLGEEVTHEVDDSNFEFEKEEKDDNVGPENQENVESEESFETQKLSHSEETSNLLNPEEESYDLVDLTGRKMPNRIVGSHEFDEEHVPSERPDTKVHDLFEDDD